MVKHAINYCNACTMENTTMVNHWCADGYTTANMPIIGMLKAAFRIYEM